MLDENYQPLEKGQGFLGVRGPTGCRYLDDERQKDYVKNGWNVTGDVFELDEEGYFYIVDRKKELIKPGGFQVWPREVEEVISNNPKVLEVGVAGIPDAQSGEALHIYFISPCHDDGTFNTVH